MAKGYTPLLDDEQDVLRRLLHETGELYVAIKGWGYHPNPEVIIGDKRIQLRFQWTFRAPDQPMFVPYLDLELRDNQNQLLHSERYPTTMPNGQCLVAQTGVTIQLVWDISIGKLSPDLIKRVKRGISGKILMSKGSL